MLQHLALRRALFLSTTLSAAIASSAMAQTITWSDPPGGNGNYIYEVGRPDGGVDVIQVGPTTIPADGSLVIGGNIAKSFACSGSITTCPSSSLAIVNNGIIEQRTRTVQLPGTLTNNGVYEIQGDFRLASGGVFTNTATGILRKTAGSADVIAGNEGLGVQFVNSGTVDVAAGTRLDLTGGYQFFGTPVSATILDGSRFIGGGTAAINSAPATFVGNVFSSDNTLLIGTSSGGFQGGDGSAGSSAILHGTVRTQGTGFTGNWQIAADGILTSAAFARNSVTGTLTNSGTFIGQANMYIEAGGRMVNEGVYDLLASNERGYANGLDIRGNFVNLGTFLKSAGVGENVLITIGDAATGYAFDNAGGTIEARAGTLAFQANGTGGQIYRSGSRFTGAGSIIVHHATLVGDFTSDGALRLQANLLGGDGTAGSSAIAHGRLTQENATLTGNWQIASDGIVTATNGGVALEGNLTNNGQYIVRSTLIIRDGARFVNAGILDLLSGNALPITGGTLINTGTILKSGGDPNVTITPLGNSTKLLDNAGGRIEVREGALFFDFNDPAELIFRDGSHFAGAGRAAVRASTFVGTTTSENYTLDLSGGNIVGGDGTTGSAATIGGEARWSGGTLTGNWIFDEGSTIRLGNPAVGGTSARPSGTLVNNGRMEVGISLIVNSVDGSLLTNNGVIDLGSGTQFGAGTTGTVVGIVNNGTIQALSGGDVNFQPGNNFANSIRNNGTILVRDTRIIGGNYVNDGAVTLGSNANWLSAGQFTLRGANAVLNIGDAGAGPGMLTGSQLIFDGGGTLAFNHDSANYAFSPQLSGLGAIRQIAGVTHLTGGNGAFGGAVSVTGGTLLQDATLGGGANGNASVVVSGLGAFGGIGTTRGSVTFTSGGRLIGVAGQAMTMDSLSLGQDTLVDVTLGAPGAAALFNVTGNLLLDGHLGITDAGGYGLGVYRLFNYGGTLTDQGLDIVSQPGDFSGSVQTSVAGQVNLVVGEAVGPTPDIQFWDGAATTPNGAVDGGTGSWDNGTANWTRADGSVNEAWSGRFAVFQGASGTVTIDPAGVSASGIQFASDGYRLEGGALTLLAPTLRVGTGTAEGSGFRATIAGHIAGSVGIEKTDLGTLILTGANSYTGGTVVQEGVLQGSVRAIRGDVAVGSGATIAFDQAVDASFGDGVSGAGTLVKLGAGTLTLTGANSYTGGSRVLQGILQGNAGSIRGDVAISSGARVLFDQAGSASFTGVISGAGGITKQGAGTLTLTGANSYAGTTQVLAGTLQGNAGSIRGDANIAAGATLAFDQATDASFAGVVSGSGTFAKLGVGTLLLTGDSSAFAGLTDIRAGTLSVNGSLGGTLTVAAGATLKGSGTIANLTVTSGVTVAPGNSIGTLAVSGNFVQQAGSTYQVEINPAGQSDLIRVGGTAVIEGGQVFAEKAAGTYLPGTRFTILSAAGGVTGRYDSLAQNMPFVDLSLAYDAGNVYLDVARNLVAFCAVASTANQCATGNGVESTGSGTLYDAIVSLPSDTAAREAFTALSGELYATARGAVLNDTRMARDAVLARLSGTEDRTAAWGQILGQWGGGDAGAGAVGYDGNGYGILMGIDAPVGAHLRAGIAGGYSRTTLDLDGRGDRGTLEARHVLGYVGGSYGALRFRAGVGYADTDFSSVRSAAFSGFSDTLRGKVDGSVLQGFAELGYVVSFKNGSLEPFAGYAAARVKTGAFAEDGGAARLEGSRIGDSTDFSTLGLRGEVAMGPVNFQASGAWRHAFGNVAPITSLSFSGGSDFTLQGTPISRDEATVEAGIAWRISRRVTAGVRYTGTFGNSGRSNGARAALAISF